MGEMNRKEECPSASVETERENRIEYARMRYERIGMGRNEMSMIKKKRREPERSEKLETKKRPTYPPLNLPSVRQATSRERPAPMIKLVGFNISGMPNRNNRNNRRNNDQTGERERSAKIKRAKRTQAQKGGSKMKQRSELQKG